MKDAYPKYELIIISRLEVMRKKISTFLVRSAQWSATHISN